MAPSDASSNRWSLPDTYVAVPISADQIAAVLRVCAVVKRQPDPVGGQLVVLRHTMDARALLGCLCDAAGRIHQWLEIQVQCLDGLAGSPAVCREAISNASLDERWARHFAALLENEQHNTIATGWETRHPLPVFLDVPAGRPLHPIDEKTGRNWTLCTDEAALQAAKLPGYGASLHRYLCVAESPGVFVPVTADTPENASTAPLDKAIPAVAKLVPLNPAGGLMIVREFQPLSYDSFVSVLTGGTWDGITHGKTLLEFRLGPSPSEAWSPLDAHGRLFLEPHGRAGKMAEVFHLKLLLLGQAFAAVRTLARHQQRPLLNITHESFQVTLPEPSPLPFLWSARVRLCDPGDAVMLPVKGSDARYYARAGAAKGSVYHPAYVGAASGGYGSVRIREVTPGNNGVLLEGTLAAEQERISATRSDILWLRLPVQNERVDLFAHVEPNVALGPRELRFRTVPLRLPAAAESALRATAGAPIHNVMFEILPVLCTPCDLYALAVLAVRTLLVNKRTTLPKAADEIISLAREVAGSHDKAMPLGARIKAIFAKTNHWNDSLGPQRLIDDDLAPDAAFACIPEPLWFDALAAIIRMLPGLGPDSVCRDYGDALPGGLHKVFDRSIADLSDLVLRSRSLIVADWHINLEINSIISEFAAKK